MIGWCCCILVRKLWTRSSGEEVCSDLQLSHELKQAAAQAEHVQCIIVMPGDAPENKQVTTLLRYSFQKFEPTRVVGPGSQLWSYSGPFIFSIGMHVFDWI